MIDDEKYLKELHEHLAIIVKDKSIVDRELYNAIACKIKSESDEDIKECISIIKENDSCCGNDFAGVFLALHNAFMLFEINKCHNMS